jgi:enediyne biosynthesis protein E4
LDATMRIKSLQHPWPKDMDPQARQEAFTRQMAEHARLYPALPLPIVAYHNRGNLRFEDATHAWGTAAPGVHQGIAFGDFDGDGDLDFVVNNLNSVCGIYRNETSAPRVAVRLHGLAPNTQGIGAQVKLLGGAVPAQSQEVVCGGRYLSGFDPLLVFAAGETGREMRIEVRWRSGKTRVVPGVHANRIYEIEEAVAHDKTPGVDRIEKQPPVRWFQDASELIQHEHVETRFDDFARQPLLPKRLSQLGPGVSWFDIDGDGHEDLLVGTGAGGFLGVYHNDGHGSFKRRTDLPLAATVPRDQTSVLAMRNELGHTVILCGSANYADGLPTGCGVRQYDLGRNLLDESFPAHASSTGPLALADIDGHGDLDLFVGGRVVPGRYPEPAVSRIYRRQDGVWRLDESNTRVLANVGLVSGAVWSDLDGDGFPELILACEWGPLRIFHNTAGALREVTEELGMSTFTGWWSGVTTGDIDGDGQLDIIAGNWGLNSPYRASPEHPLRLFYGDFNGQGTVDLVETEYDPRRQRDTPRLGLDSQAAGLPFLRERFPTFKAYSEAGIDEVLGNLRPRASIVEVRTLASMVFFNRGHRFEPVALPTEAQMAPAFSVNVADFDGDGCEDIFLSQNFFALSPEVHRLDAGRGLLLRGDGRGALAAVPGQESGIEVYGEQRGAALGDFNEDGRIDLAVAQNGAATKLYLNTGAQPGLRIRLAGPPGNPTGAGAVIRLQYGEHWGPAREIHAGSGYWSQDSAVQVMATPSLPKQVQVRWPGGKTATTELSPGLREVCVDHEGRIQSSR